VNNIRGLKLVMMTTIIRTLPIIYQVTDIVSVIIDYIPLALDMFSTVEQCLPFVVYPTEIVVRQYYEVATYLDSYHNILPAHRRYWNHMVFHCDHCQSR